MVVFDLVGVVFGGYVFVVGIGLWVDFVEVVGL